MSMTTRKMVLDACSNYSYALYRTKIVGYVYEDPTTQACLLSREDVMVASAASQFVSAPCPCLTTSRPSPS
jgi:hypothetical protein